MVDPFVFLVMAAAIIWLGTQVLAQRSAIRDLESRLDHIDDAAVDTGLHHRNGHRRASA